MAASCKQALKRSGKRVDGPGHDHNKDACNPEAFEHFSAAVGALRTLADLTGLGMIDARRKLLQQVLRFFVDHQCLSF